MVTGASKMADVTLSWKGKVLGRTRTLNGFTQFKLPVGRQVVQLENVRNHHKRAVQIDVVEGRKNIEAALD